jgi:SNF2 family DNA or RNA helicase
VTLSAPALTLAIAALRPFQAEGVAEAQAFRRCLIADEPGLGKTIESLAVVEAEGAYPAVVVCPAGLKLNWEREIEKWLPHRTVTVLSGQKPKPFDAAHITVLNYDILHYWQAYLGAPRALIFDESHMLKNVYAKRTRAAFNLTSRLMSDDIVLLLSGTPILNRPVELVPQLGILGVLAHFGGGDKFRDRYCHPRVQRVWNKKRKKYINITLYDGAENLDELNACLRKSCMVRRTKAEVLDELPPKVRSTLWLPGDKAVMRSYRKAEADVVGYLAAQARQLAEETGVDVEAAADAAAQRAASAEHMVRINQLRQLVAQAKLPAVFEWVDDFPAPLVIFVHHRAIAQALLDRYDCPAVRGGMTAEEKQAAVDAFQAGAPRIVCSIQAASFGLTLTAASNELFVEQAWTPAMLEQAESRCHRIGQHDSVTAWYAAIADTIDETIFRLLRSKRDVVDAITDGQSIAGGLVAELTQKGLQA